MSKADNTTENYRDEGSSERRALLGMLRWMIPTVTRTGQWMLKGIKQIGGKDETLQAPVFQGIGFFFRPPIGANAESIVAFPGGARDNAAVIAQRDEDTRQKVVKELGCLEGEGLVYNDLVAIKFTRSGLIQCWVIGGPVPLQLALLSDVSNAITAYNGHTHPAPGGTTSAVLPADRAPTPVGSSGLRG